MSASTRTSIERALTLCGELLTEVSAPHSLRIEEARAALFAAEAAEASALESERAASSAHYDMRTAEAEDDSLEVALESAEEYMRSCADEHAACVAATAAAQTALNEAMAPLDNLTNLEKYIRNLAGDFNADPGRWVSCVEWRVGLVVKEAKAPHPAIGLAETKLASCEAAVTAARSAFETANRVNGRVVRALSSADTEANRIAAEGTARRLEEARSAAALAEEALTSAKAELSAAVVVIAKYLELEALVRSIASAASARAAELRREAEAEAAASRVAESSSSDRDSGCTCWELNCPCDYCKSEAARLRWESEPIDFTK